MRETRNIHVVYVLSQSHVQLPWSLHYTQPQTYRNVSCIPQGHVLAPLLFIYASVQSHPLSKCSVTYEICASGIAVYHPNYMCHHLTQTFVVILCSTLFLACETNTPLIFRRTPCRQPCSTSSSTKCVREKQLSCLAYPLVSA